MKRVRLMLLLVATACGRAAPNPATHPTTTTVAAAPAEPALPPTAPAVAAAPPLDEATVIAKSHAFIAAWDANDIAAFEAVTAPELLRFETGRFYDRTRLTSGMQARSERKAPPITHTWGDERAVIAGDVAYFVGEGTEHVPAQEDRPASEPVSWNTLVWRRDGGAWKVSHWQLQKGGVEGEHDKWNEVFRTSVGFNHEANKLLVETVKGVKPGKALDLATGQGRNALYLARQKWKTTGVDISDEGLRQARAVADKAKLPLTTVQADLDQWDLGKDRWDLITLIYAGDDPKMVERMQAALKKKGLIVIEFFHKDATKGTGIGGFAPGALAAQFAGPGWEILRDDVVEDISDWGLRRTKLVRFVARKK